MKKFLKYFLIIIIVIFLICIAIVGRKVAIISKLDKNVSNLENTEDNIYMKVNNVVDSTKEVETELFIIGDIEKSINVVKETTKRTQIVYPTERKVFIEAEGNKTLSIYKETAAKRATDVNAAPTTHTVLPNYVHCMSIIERIIIALNTNIKSTSIDGKECYELSGMHSPIFLYHENSISMSLYVEKDTGLPIKLVEKIEEDRTEKEYLTEYEIKFDIVTEKDLAEPDNSEYTMQENNNIVIIKNNKIQNENLIDEFIEKAVDTTIESQELNIKQDDVNIKVTYTPGEYAKAMNSQSSEESTNVPLSDGSFESNKKIYGYYTLIVNEEVKGEYPLRSHTIRRTTSSDKIVTLYFDALLIDYISIPEICKYDLDSSNYNKKFDLSYNQRKDLGIKNVYDADMYSVKTFGGDVDIIIEDDMVYSLENALNEKVITSDDILEKAKIDYKYGICEEAYYSDGGSVEYMYNTSDENKYTILKLNTLDNEKDLIIGMGGQIINLYHEKNK